VWVDSVRHAPMHLARAPQLARARAGGGARHVLLVRSSSTKSSTGSGEEAGGIGGDCGAASSLDTPNGKSRLHGQILHFAEMVYPTDKERQARGRAFVATRKVVTEALPGSQVHMFGSSSTGLALPGSDLDIVVLRRPTSQLNAPYRLLRRVRNEMARSQLHDRRSDINLINAKVPLIKFTERASNAQVDLSCNSIDGLRNSQAIRFALASRVELQPLLLVLKSMLKQRGLNETFNGGIGSYLLFCMTLARIEPRVGARAMLWSAWEAGRKEQLQVNLGPKGAAEFLEEHSLESGDMVLEMPSLVTEYYTGTEAPQGDGAKGAAAAVGGEEADEAVEKEEDVVGGGPGGEPKAAAEEEAEEAGVEEVKEKEADEEDEDEEWRYGRKETRDKFSLHRVVRAVSDGGEANMRHLLARGDGAWSAVSLHEILQVCEARGLPMDEDHLECIRHIEAWPDKAPPKGAETSGAAGPVPPHRQFEPLTNARLAVLRSDPAAPDLGVELLAFLDHYASLPTLRTLDPLSPGVDLGKKARMFDEARVLFAETAAALREKNCLSAALVGWPEGGMLPRAVLHDPSFWDRTRSPLKATKAAARARRLAEAKAAAAAARIVSGAEGADGGGPDTERDDADGAEEPDAGQRAAVAKPESRGALAAALVSGEWSAGASAMLCAFQEGRPSAFVLRQLQRETGMSQADVTEALEKAWTEECASPTPSSATRAGAHRSAASPPLFRRRLH